MWLSLVHCKRLHCSLASAVLLDCGLTLGALLRVRVEPVGSFRIVRAFLLPFLDDPTKHWAMVVCVAASEAHRVPTFALNSRHKPVEHAWRRLCAFDGVFTSGMGAPAKGRRIGNEGSVQQLVIPTCQMTLIWGVLPCRDRRINNGIDNFLANHSVAPALHALNGRALSFALDLARDVLLPAHFAESMSTAERKRLRVEVFRRVVIATDGAVERLPA